MAYLGIELLHREGLFKGSRRESLYEGHMKISQKVDRAPIEVLFLTGCFFDNTNTNNGIFKKRCSFSLSNNCSFSFNHIKQ